MKKLSEMTDEDLALSYINGDNRAFDYFCRAISLSSFPIYFLLLGIVMLLMTYSKKHL